MRDLRGVIVVRALRGFADGFVSLLLVRYLTTIGYTPARIGAVVTATLLGSAVLTLAMGWGGNRLPARRALLAASMLMAATGVGFAGVTAFLPLLVVAAVGTLNPSGGDVSVFLPLEQSYIAGRSPSGQWARVYGVYNVAGTVAAACGALASALPELVADAAGADLARVQRLSFGVYIVVAVSIAAIYRRLPGDVVAQGRSRSGTIRGSGRIVGELAALFSLDSAASGLAAQAIMILWLHLRFGLSSADLGVLFFASGLLGGASQLLAGRIALRFGLIRTMVFSHLPANALLALAGFAPNAPVAIVVLLVRSLFSQMDVPARQAFVMAVVPPEARSAAASITNVPRSLAAALTPALAGALLASTGIGWPLVLAGVLKTLYDLLLLARFRNHVPVGLQAAT